MEAQLRPERQLESGLYYVGACIPDETCEARQCFSHSNYHSAMGSYCPFPDNFNIDFSHLKASGDSSTCTLNWSFTSENHIHVTSGARLRPV